MNPIHRCRECRKPCHAISGCNYDLDGEEFFGADTLCKACFMTSAQLGHSSPKRRLIEGLFEDNQNPTEADQTNFTAIGQANFPVIGQKHVPAIGESDSHAVRSPLSSKQNLPTIGQSGSPAAGSPVTSNNHIQALFKSNSPAASQISYENGSTSSASVLPYKPSIDTHKPVPGNLRDKIIVFKPEKFLEKEMLTKADLAEVIVVMASTLKLMCQSFSAPVGHKKMAAQAILQVYGEKISVPENKDVYVNTN